MASSFTLLDDTPATQDGLGVQGFVETLFEALLSFQRSRSTPAGEDVSVSPPTVAIYGPWGSGKSSVLNLLEARFKEHAAKFDPGAIDKPVFQVIRFSPWQHRHEPNQLIPLLLELHRQCPATDKEKLQLIAALVLVPAATVAVAAHYGDFATAAALAGPHLGKATKALGSLAKTDKWTKLKAWLASWRRPRPTISEHARLKQTIAEFIREARGRKTEASAQLRTLVILIDDLDRCHPPERVVELLEHIKVFLDCEGCLFVLACDRDAVTRAIESKFPGHGAPYLEKFVTLGLTLPPPTSFNLLRTILRDPPAPPVPAAGSAPSALSPEEQKAAELAKLEERYFFERVVKVLDLNPRRAKRFSNAWHTARRALERIEAKCPAFDPLLLAKWLLLREMCPAVTAQPLRVLALEQRLGALNPRDRFAVDPLLAEFGLGREMMDFLRGDAEQGRRFESALLLSRFLRLTGEETDMIRAEAERLAAAGKPIPGDDLTEVDLNFAQLHGADFSGADRWLRRIQFIGANLRDADFRGADLEGASFRRAKLEGTDFRGANLALVDFGEAVLGEKGVRLLDARGLDNLSPATPAAMTERLRRMQQDEAVAESFR